MTDVVTTGGALGRHEEHDPESYGYVFDVSAAPATLTSTKHRRVIGVLDQGSLGSCTGNATTGCMGTEPFMDTVPKGTTLDETYAVKVYELATQLDSIKGTYPPTDTGSSGIGAAKAAQQLGLIGGYTHTFTFDTALAALMLQPLIIGIPWLTGMDSPDSNGNVTVTGTVRGGHEICMDELDVENQRVGLTNSWGDGWGLSGRFYIPFSGFKTLLSRGGDVTGFTLNTQPAPTSNPDTLLWGQVKDWAKAKHVDGNKTAAADVTAWARAKGLTA